jgi:hypothetical protein
MAQKTINKLQREVHLKSLKKHGAQGFYERIVGAGMMKAASMDNPEVIMLDRAEAFMALSRRDGEYKQEYFIISKILRRAAHIVYRQLLRQNKSKKTNNRFFNLVA